jgi:hypothetical protein
VRPRSTEVHLDAAARIGVLALTITVAATMACPELHVLSWWDRSALGRMFTGVLGPGGSSLVFGFAPFTSGAIASWLAGATAGTVCGVFGALHVRRRVALASVTV